MKLGILLSLGSSFSDQKKSGQDKRFVDYYLKKYNQFFEEINIFTYQNESYPLPEKCYLISNKENVQRFFYSFLLPIIHRNLIKKLDVFRVMQLTGVIPAILINIIYRKPFIFTYGYNYSEFSKLEGYLIRPLLYKILELLAFNFTSGVIVTTKSMEDKLKNKYPRTNIIYIPNGVDINQFIPRNKLPAVSSQQSVNKILFVGRLEWQKNLVNLIKAISLFPAKFNIKLLFIGQGSMKKVLENLAKKLKVNLTIINKIPHNQIVKYYQRADIFVLPSYIEGHPKVLLEAMACSLPCLVSQFIGAREYINEKEIMITDFSSIAISNNLKRLIEDNRLKERLGIHARLRIEKDFDINKLIREEISILQHA